MPECVSVPPVNVGIPEPSTRDVHSTHVLMHRLPL